MPDAARRAVAATVLAAATLAACGGGGEPVEGSGLSETQPRNVGEFTRVRFDGDLDLEIRIGSPSEFEVTADDNVVDLITTEVEDGLLTIDLPDDLTAKTPVRVSATIESFQELDARGSGSVRLRDLDEGEVRLAVDGALSLRADGVADELVLEATGAVSADVAELEVERAEVTVEGAGDVAVNATDELVVEVQGAASVTYLGSPSVESRIEGGGTVTKVDPEAPATTG